MRARRESEIHYKYSLNDIYVLAANFLFAACDPECTSGCSVKGAGYCDTTCSSPNFGLAIDYTCQRM